MKLNQNILDDIFQDNMILPLNKWINIGGKVLSNEEVEIIFNNINYKTKADINGTWKTKLSPINKLNKYNLLVQTKDKKQIIKNIQFGKVYLLSGQSNIEFRLKDEEHFEKIKKILSNNKFSNLYYYNVPQIDYIDPKSQKIKPKDLKPELWHKVNVDNCGEMSAIGFYMIEKLAKLGNKEPIAIVDCFKGGTSASCWIKKKDLEQNPELKKHFLDKYYSEIAGKTWDDFQQETEKYNEQVNQHNKSLSKFLKMHPDVSLSTAKNIVGHTPWPPPTRPDLFTRPCGLYHTMLRQVKNFSFNEMVWYQGENDTDRVEQYKLLLPILINTWRKELEDLSLPIKLIQLPGYADYLGNSGAIIRQTQLKTSLNMPQVDLVSFIDGGEEHNIHPTNKQKMGQRLGTIVNGNTYAGTPFVKNIIQKTNQLILNIARCEHIKLMMPTILELTFNDETQKIVTLNETNLMNSQIVITINKKVKSISYGYSNFPKNIGIYNEVNYPLSPFRIRL